MREGFVDRRKKIGLGTGDVLSMLQIAILIASLGVAWAKFQATQDQVTIHTHQLDRVEHYLSSHDPHYWNEQ